MTDSKVSKENYSKLITALKEICRTERDEMSNGNFRAVLIYDADEMESIAKRALESVGEQNDRPTDS